MIIVILMITQMDEAFYVTDYVNYSILPSIKVNDTYIFILCLRYSILYNRFRHNRAQRSLENTVNHSDTI